MSSEWVAAGAAVAAAVIGPLVSVYILKRQNEAAGLIARRQSEAADAIARRQISASLISANRQAWIDRLRDAIAEFQAMTWNLGFRGAISMEVGPEEDQRVANALLLRSRIALLINPHESDHKRLLDLIDKAMSVTYAAGHDARKELAGAQHEITELAQTVLKREWVRVKEGEPDQVELIDGSLS